MNERIKNHLIQNNTKKGYATDDRNLIETVTEGQFVWEGGRDEHRWYTLVETVVNVDGMLLCYDRCDVKGEQSDVEDCIGGYKLDDIHEVEPKQITTIIYVPVQENK